MVDILAASSIFNAIKPKKQQTSKTVTTVRDGHSGSFVQPKLQKRRKEYKKRLRQR